MLKEAFLSFEALGFNRYMVECESIKMSADPTNKLVLIDTWWNVNKLSIHSISRKSKF